MQTFSNPVTVERRRDAKRLADVTVRVFWKRSEIPEGLLFAAAVSLLPFGHMMRPGAFAVAVVTRLCSIDIDLFRRLRQTKTQSGSSSPYHLSNCEDRHG